MSHLDIYTYDLPGCVAPTIDISFVVGRIGFPDIDSAQSETVTIRYENRKHTIVANKQCGHGAKNRRA